jgi:hypothetical protein
VCNFIGSSLSVGIRQNAAGDLRHRGGILTAPGVPGFQRFGVPIGIHQDAGSVYKMPLAALFRLLSALCQIR